MSDCLKHYPAGIWAHLHPSDGPTTQYRKKHNFYLLANKVFSYGSESATWNYLEAGHGKGAADSVGAVVKRTADAFVNKGGDITKAADLVKALEACTSVKLMTVSEVVITNVEEEIPLSVKPIPKTVQIHQVHVYSV